MYSFSCWVRLQNYEQGTQRRTKDGVGGDDSQEMGAMASHLGAERRPWPLMDTCLDDGDPRAYWGIAAGCSHPCSRMQPTRASREGPLYCRTCCRPPTKKLEHRLPRSSSAKLARHQWLGKVCVDHIDCANNLCWPNPTWGWSSCGWEVPRGVTRD